MILVSMFRNGQSIDPHDGNDGPHYSPEKALAKLVERLKGDAGVIRIGPNRLTINQPSTNEHVMFVGDENDMTLLHDVCLLYIQARPWLCNESVRKLIG